jgi:tripartite-type tricarboxylate transporter receptor subunit TctC
MKRYNVKTKWEVLMNLKIKTVAATVAFVVASMGVAVAGDFPEHPVEVIVPWPPGDLEDVIARLISDQIQKD